MAQMQKHPKLRKMTNATSDGSLNNNANGVTLMSEELIRQDISEVKILLKGLTDSFHSYNQRLIVIEEHMRDRPSKGCEKGMWVIADKSQERAFEKWIADHKTIHEEWDKSKLDEDTKRASKVKSIIDILFKISPFLLAIFLYLNKLIEMYGG